MALCRNGDRDQLRSELQQLATARVALYEEYVPIDRSAGTGYCHLFLQSLLEAASTGGHTDTVELLLFFGQHHGVAVRDLVTPSTITAAFHENTLEILLKFKVVEPEVFSLYGVVGSNTLSAACYGGPHSEPVPRRKNLNLVRYMMESGFDPNGDWVPGSTRSGNLYIACGDACLEIVECLLEHGAVVAHSGATRVAARKGRIDVLEALLQNGADLNEIYTRNNGTGLRGLHSMSPFASGQIATVEWLLQCRADVNIRNMEGKTAGDLLPENGDEALKKIVRRE